MPNYKPYSQDQPMLLPLNLRDMIPSDHILNVINIIVEELDFSKIYTNTRNDEGGRAAYHPRMLCKVLFYAYTQGIRSSRQIAEKLRSDIYFMYLAGMQTPDFRTISDFRKNNIEQLKPLFVQIVLICIKLNLITFSHIAIDGTKLRASAGRRKTLSEKKLQEELKEVNDGIEKLLEEAQRVDEEEDKKYGTEKRGDEIPEELKSKQLLREKILKAKELLEQKELKEVNITDPDSRFMKSADGSKNVSYNAQIAVDADHHIIVANDVVSEPTDQHQFIPMYNQVIENTGEKPAEVSADCGYDTNKNYIYIGENDINAYLPDQMLKKETDENGQEHIAEYDRRHFIYDEQKDRYICPAGQVITHKNSHIKNGVHYDTYVCKMCPKCPLKEKCTTAKYREIIFNEADKIKKEMRRKLLTEQGKKTYMKRLYTAEPPFGHIKRILGYTYFLLRGLIKTKGEYNLMCIAFNLKKIYLCIGSKKLADMLSSMSSVKTKAAFLLQHINNSINGGAKDLIQF